MTENITRISNSKYVNRAVIVMVLICMMDRCHGQSWWSWGSSPPPPSALTDSSTAAAPSISSASAPVTSPSISFPSFGAIPPSSSSADLLTSAPPSPSMSFSSFGAIPPSSSSADLFSAPPSPSMSFSSFGAIPPSSSSADLFSAPPSPSMSFSSFGATPPSSSSADLSTAAPPSPTFSTITASPPSLSSWTSSPPSQSTPTSPATPPSPTFSVPSSPAPPPSTAPPPRPTNSTTLFVMSTSFSFGFETIYTSVQDAIDAVPENNTELYTIEIFSGTYLEKVSIPATKPFITLQGAGRNTTIISYNDTANSTNSTVKSSTFSVFAANFTARNVTFQNSAPHASAGETGAQAVAMRVDGDMAAFYGCGFISSQDTICDEAGRHYFRDCYIEGNIDIIWGNGQSLYEYTQIQSTAIKNTGSITAQGRNSDNETTGFSFVGGSITGTGKNILGRAYGLYSRVFFIDTYMEDIINPVGWSNWPTSNVSKGSRRLLDNSTVRHEQYGEYGNTGPGANLTGRVSWMLNLSEAEVANLTSLSFIDGTLWLSSET
ncbi:putative pectinesterase 14 [Physcomitrium patens]|uniref:pectinesterase n=1 Tax=Physcomitrium patens TaxID=3218 RepID=A0A2K1K5R1_PHYPA|nr:probable pectinesterase 68 [Physcomitrium patens]PNR49121.1 hypothetical protein PHYPA_011017 [Physcomitrium patens]|eukprot:XP_024382487.1 probable pectinesterase 68 [Physcomitrella patens]